MARLIRDWRRLDTEQRRALGAAVALFVTMLLPWYQQNGFVKTKSAEVRADTHNLTAFGAFSFVEAAVLLVALAVAYLVFARAEGRDFNVPGSDGAVVFAAGIWTALLLVYRLFDKPSISNGTAANVGVQWGIFFALAAAGLLAYTGSRMRAAHHGHGLRGAGPRVARHRHHSDPGPEARRHDEPGGGGPDRRREGDRRREPQPAPARPRRDAGSRDEELTAVQPGRGARGTAGPAPEGDTVAGRSRPRYPPPPAAPAEQMSFDDTPERDA